MQEIRTVTVNRREIPVLISDEKEALLAAKTAGRAIVGLWRPGQEMEEISAARYVVENLADVTEEFLDRVARRHLGLPWHICETERLVIREMFADDFDEVWTNQIGLGLNSVEELQAYTKNQYVFYEFGIWALVEKESGELVGVAGLKVPEEIESDHVDELVLDVGMGRETLELGYHIFSRFRRKGYAKEACEAVIRYGVCELGVGQFLVRIDKENIVSKRLAEGLGFFAGN
ncbi:MAG: GNAT family N-acetyltransferase [Lachnospiraceae bacterium]|nr:GNAT family N-acetyltransferase [Lachnospiraceae bacterium]